MTKQCIPGVDLMSATSVLVRRAGCLMLIMGASSLVQPCAGGSGVFEETGGLGTGRYLHTATLLSGGKVLVTGGRTGFPSGHRLASAELYDPASGTWTDAGSLVSARQQHTATLLLDGKVLVAGGVGNSGALVSVQLYDPASGTWADTGNLATARANHTATLLPNGKVLVAGNYIFSSGASAELYDPASGTWADTSSMIDARSGHTATLLPNGKVLVAGGIGGSDSSQSAELYDLASGTWVATGRLGTGRDSHTETLLPNGTVLVAGGFPDSGGVSASAEFYDPESGTWTATASLANARFSHTATLLPNGTVLVAGGNNGSALWSAELYDPPNGTWTDTSSMTDGRSSHTATLLPDGKVLLAGGFVSNSSGALAGAEVYVAQPGVPTLLNISTRLRVLTGDNVLIGGFIITGTDPKDVLIRGIGPSLSGVGVPGPLADSTLELHQGSTLIAVNDNWKMRPDGSSQQAEIEGTTIAPANDLESAIRVTLEPGAYTAILAGKDGGIGVGLVEVYDLAPSVNSTLANISARGLVETGDNVMIGGFIVGEGSGGGSARVLVRALGPSVPVASALGDPTLELHDGSGTLVAANDNWKTRPDGGSQQEEIEATTIPPANDLESALVRTLPAGNYTAIVRGTNNTIGAGLVEVYNLP